MRIVVWNCAERLRGAKLKALEDLEPDIAVVPHCESPERLWGKQPLLAPIPMEWIGDDDKKGLAVLAFHGYRVQRHADYDFSLRWLLPVEIHGPVNLPPVNFRLLGVWAVNQRLPRGDGEELSGQPLEAADRYHAFLAAGPAIVAGDFRNNVRWDQGKKATNHAHTVAGLERLGMASAYHVGRGELHGKESRATCYSRSRKPDGRKYHVDYCFLPLDWCSQLREVEVGAFDAWVGKGLSDHVPLVVDIDLPLSTGGKAPALEKTRRSDLS